MREPFELFACSAASSRPRNALHLESEALLGRQQYSAFSQHGPASAGCEIDKFLAHQKTVLTDLFLISSFVNHSHSLCRCFFCNTAPTNMQHVWQTIIELKKSILGVGIAPVPPECPTLCLSWPRASWGGPQSSQAGYYHPNFYDTEYPIIKLLKTATSM